MSKRNYDLLAVDLDGTLLGTDGRVSAGNLAAIEAARADGLEVVICTGRAYKETSHILDAIDGRTPAHGRTVAPIVTTGGAAVVDAATDTFMHAQGLGADLVQRLCARFESHGRAPLLLKDHSAAGCDYLVVKYGPLEYASEWWFSNMPLDVRYIDHIDDDAHPDDTIRIGFAAATEVMQELADPIMQDFKEEAFMQYFPAVSGSHKAGPDGVKDQTVQLLEVFHKDVTKWTGIQALAASQGIEESRIAAIGDEINDLAMIEHAALGIAMDNAVPKIKEVADKEAAHHGADGVAEAIELILDGTW